MTDIVISGQPRPRLDGACFFCRDPLDVFGANVRSSTSNKVVGYACGTCAEANRRTVQTRLPVAVRELTRPTQGRCTTCRSSRVLVAGLTFDDGTVEEVCGRCVRAVL